MKILLAILLLGLSFVSVAHSPVKWVPIFGGDISVIIPIIVLNESKLYKGDDGAFYVKLSQTHNGNILKIMAAGGDWNITQVTASELSNIKVTATGTELKYGNFYGTSDKEIKLVVTGNQKELVIANNNGRYFAVTPVSENNNVKLSYKYDALGRLRVTKHANGTTSEYEYDKANNRTKKLNYSEIPNRAPIAKSEFFTMRPGTIAGAWVLQNDTDPDGDELSIVSVNHPHSPNITYAIAACNKKCIEIQAFGSVYDYPVIYEVDDGHGNRATAILYLTVSY